MVNRHRRTNQKRYTIRSEYRFIRFSLSQTNLINFRFRFVSICSGSSHGGPSNSNTQKHHKQRMVNINNSSTNVPCPNDSSSQAVNEETIGNSTNSVAGSALPTIQSTSSNVITNSCFIAGNSSNNLNSNSNLNNNGNNSSAANLNLKVSGLNQLKIEFIHVFL